MPSKLGDHEADFLLTSLGHHEPRPWGAAVGAVFEAVKGNGWWDDTCGMPSSAGYRELVAYLFDRQDRYNEPRKVPWTAEAVQRMVDQVLTVDEAEAIMSSARGGFILQRIDIARLERVGYLTPIHRNGTYSHDATKLGLIAAAQTFRDEMRRLQQLAEHQPVESDLVRLAKRLEDRADLMLDDMHGTLARSILMTIADELANLDKDYDHD